jgi:hypothetical protein
MNAAQAQHLIDARDIARQYIRSGLMVIPIPALSKGPEVTNWQDLRITEKDVPKYFKPNSNVGALLGLNGIADADLDCPEAIRIGAEWLPSTSAVFGRSSKPRPHYLYKLDKPLPSQQFKDPLAPDDEKAMLSEFRCLTRAGTVGLQTVLPGSVHPSGEVIEWTNGIQQPAPVDGESLRLIVARIAAACLLARHWPSKGKRHETMLALIGTLARANWSQEDSCVFCNQVAANARTGSSERTSQVSDNVNDTFEKLRDRRPTTGLTKLKDLLPEAVVA